MTDDSLSGAEERVLVVHGYGRSAEIICRLLARAGLHCETRSDVVALAEAFEEGAGAAVVGGDVVTAGCEPLKAALSAQPVWSDLPVIVLVPAGHQEVGMTAIADALGPRTLAKVLEQPARSFELISLVQTALRTRRRQYELRDHLQRERELHVALQQSQADLRALNRDLEQRVEDRTAQVRELSKALSRAEQQERRRISQILHDDLQQMLYGIQIKIGLIRRHAGASGYSELLDDVTQVETWAVRAMETARRLSVDLSPPILKNEGLADALAWLAATMQDLHGLKVDIVADHAFQMPDEDLRVLLFQMVRELLFNVAKHAGIGRAKVSLVRLDHTVRIDVVDEGRGFDINEVASRAAADGGFGLFSVRERLQLFGGRMEIKSRPGDGTRVRLDVPVDR